MLRVETDREDDGRWLAEVPELPGALAYGVTEVEARQKVEALALRILADCHADDRRRRQRSGLQSTYSIPGRNSDRRLMTRPETKKTPSPV